MDQALKLTNVLSDPTRYYIYQYISKKHGDVTVQEVADEFQIHPNVARLHLTKLEDVDMLVSETQKTGKGGRPSRLYRLSQTVVQLQFPFRDYALLSNIALDALAHLGEAGKAALYETGKRFGQEILARQRFQKHDQELSFMEKIALAKEALFTAGLSPSFEVDEAKEILYYEVFNCPYREVAEQHPSVCHMHGAMMKGIFEILFTNVEVTRTNHMLNGCQSCDYHVSHS